jgi:hypothetical protein
MLVVRGGGKERGGGEVMRGGERKERGGGEIVRVREGKERGGTKEKGRREEDVLVEFRVGGEYLRDILCHED